MCGLVSCYNKTSKMINYKEKRFVLAHNFGGFVHEQLAPLFWDCGSTSWSTCWGKPTHTISQGAKRKRKEPAFHNPF